MRSKRTQQVTANLRRQNFTRILIKVHFVFQDTSASKERVGNYPQRQIVFFANVTLRSVALRWMPA